MSPMEKQEALLQGCVIDGSDNAGEMVSVSFSGKQIEYEIEAGKSISIEDNLITVKKGGATVTLTFDGLPNSETYLYITGLNCAGMQPLDMYTDLQWKLLSIYEKNKVLHSQKYYEEESAYTLPLTITNSQGISY